jgi:hypothetical protein
VMCSGDSELVCGVMCNGDIELVCTPCLVEILNWCVQ